MTTRSIARSHLRGAALLDALLAALVLAVGMLAAAQFQRLLRQHADSAAERSIAVRLAQAELERLRHSDVAAAASETTSDVVAGASQATFRVERSAGPADGDARAVIVRVAWRDRRGDEQAVTLAGQVAAADPFAAGALLLAPAAATPSGAGGRSVHIPLDARDLGDGRSALRPVAASTETWLFDQRSAAIVSRCAPAAPSVCDGIAGTYVGGTVRFAGGGAPDPALGNDAPLAATIGVLAAGTAFARPPVCLSEERSVGSERALRYHCIVYPAPGASWSGRIVVVPSGWTLGSTATDRRVCRYSADSDGSGAVDTVYEHPADHAGVRGALPHQNFLVIAGDRACPTATAAILEPVPSGAFADASTAAHQP